MITTITTYIAQCLPYALIYTTLTGLSLLLLARLNPEIFLDDYPPDVKAKYGPMCAKTRQQRNIFGIPVLLFMVGYPIFAITQITQNNPAAFGQIFAELLFIYTFFNLFDLIVLDWLIFCTLQPRLFVLPGTEGMAGYKDYAFHFWASVKGQIGLTLFSLIGAGVMAVIL